MGNLVGPALSASAGRVGLVVSALRDDNPGAGLEVVDGGPYVLVLAPHLLCATAASLRWHLGAGFGLGDLEAMVVASVGCVRRTPGVITWQSGEPAAADVQDAVAIGDVPVR